MTSCFFAFRARSGGQLWHCITIICCLFVTGQPSQCAEGDDFPPELVAWKPQARNPIFQAAGAGHWDVKIRERGWILRDGPMWHLWYTGYDGTRPGLKMLGHATSADGLDWQRDRGNPVFKDHWVEDMMVVKAGNEYVMFAEGRDDQAQMLTSTDGKTWVRQGPVDVRLASGVPIPAGPYGTPVGYWENETWYLFYERRDAGVWLATSRDRKVWTNVQDAPVLRPGQGAHDQNLIALNQVLRYNGRYYGVYHGRGEQPVWSTSLAVSDDLRHWRKYPQNPIVGNNKSSGMLIHDGQKLRLYTMHDQVDVYDHR